MVFSDCLRPVPTEYINFQGYSEKKHYCSWPDERKLEMLVRFSTDGDGEPRERPRRPSTRQGRHYS